VSRIAVCSPRMRGLAVISLVVAIGCQKADDHKAPVTTETGSGSGSGSGSGVMVVRPKPVQVSPPVDLKTPPADATKTASGLVYKKLVANPSGDTPRRNDIVMVNYTGWNVSTGETFYSNEPHGEPMPLNLANAAPGFVEAMQLLHKGETAALWMPAAIGYKGKPPGTPEARVYEVEVVDIKRAPETPPDLAKPPDAAQTTRSGIKYEVVRPGTGKDKARSFDYPTASFTGWDSDGKMFDTTEMGRKKPTRSRLDKLAQPFIDVAENMVEGERVRFWVPSDKMTIAGKAEPGLPAGTLCYELELQKLEPGAETPPDVKAPPADAKKTAKGVFYKVLKAGPGGPHPKPTDSVKVNYSGWTTDGKMFDSSLERGQPAEFGLSAVIPGWTDGIPQMSVGDTYRFWIPDELAYKGKPGRPQGMLVFDVELLEIKSTPAGMPPPPHGHPGMEPHPGMAPPHP